MRMYHLLQLRQTRHRFRTGHLAHHHRRSGVAVAQRLLYWQSAKQTVKETRGKTITAPYSAHYWKWKRTHTERLPSCMGFHSLGTQFPHYKFHSAVE